ncbi:rap hypothetical protein [Limosa lapponica baueri]|uniref:Uncharacterized protein n=1 Tax=Limosa lapponica baueri TaxID=1758121 RepID=A0A2I0T6M4_LIMLA|nr:rap hypothetical protein [Limosa lapponica baueri]
MLTESSDHRLPEQRGEVALSEKHLKDIIDKENGIPATESEMGDVDLTGLPEAPVDSEDEEEEEDEDIDRTSDPLLGRDVVRECLEKEPADKTDDDIGEEEKRPKSLCKTI